MIFYTVNENPNPIDAKGNFEYEGNYKGRNVKKKEDNEIYSSFNETGFELQNPEYYIPNDSLFINHSNDLLQIDTDDIEKYFNKGNEADNGETFLKFS